MLLQKVVNPIVSSQQQYPLTQTRQTYLLIKFLRPSSIEGLFTTISAVGCVAFTPCISPEAASEPEVV